MGVYIILSFFINLIITPLVFIYELVFNASCNYLFGHSSFNDYLLIGIIIVSVFVNLLSLPLYNAADRLQKTEREKQKKLLNVASHIKSAFKGDERFLVLNTYYRLENYNPIFQLKTAIPLLLQIPFFTAAYIFFTNTTIFNGVSLHCIPMLKDLSKPDMLLSFNEYSINVLPLLMTIINLFSSFIYTTSLSIKDRIQPIILAVIFLFLLYNSPSALVIYWTLNNIFSLIKIIILHVADKYMKKDMSIVRQHSDKIKNDNILAIASLSAIFVLLAIFIPSNIISASPNEFTISTPFNTLKFTITIFMGYFIWSFLYYFMLPDKFKTIIASLFFAINIYFILNHVIFLNNAGNISENLVYSSGFPHFTNLDLKIDLCILFASIIIFIFSIKHVKLASVITTLLLLSIFAVSVINIYKINISITKSNKTDNSDNVNSYYNHGIKLSKSGKNIIVIMLDRSCGIYFDYVLANKPELFDEYDGFTFFENTLSCAAFTLVGAPPIFGGYDYMPQNSNKRKDTLLVEKNNEALTIMPYNFCHNGYNCFVSNLPNVNYSVNEKKSPFYNFENVSEIDLTDGVSKFFYGGIINEDANIYNNNRNFAFYSIMKVAPVIVKGLIYNDGFYLMKNAPLRLLHTLRNYYAFDNFIDKLIVNDSKFNCFIMFDNELTHNHNNNTLPPDTFSPAIIEDINKTLEYPVKDNYIGEKFSGSYSHFSTEMAAYLQIEKVLEYLKDNDVYDNTRIIITSDHGASYSSEKLLFEDVNGKGVAVNSYNPTLIYKDFDMHGKLQISNEFMTNADAPLLAMKDVIDNPVNPYINKPISEKDRDNFEIDIYGGDKGWNAENYVNDYIFDTYYVSCKTIDIFDKNNWFVKESKTD